MKRMMILIGIFVSLAMVLPAGGRKDTAKRTDGKIQVVTTIFPPYDFVREIAGDKVNLAMLLPPGAESHSFEPTPQDIIRVQNCDVFIYVGGESDAWVEQILESMDTSRMEIITLMDCVEVVEELIVEGMEEEEEEDEAEGPEYDEHVWTSPRNASLIVQKIAGVLKQRDAPNAAEYDKNTAAYTAKLADLDTSFQTMINGAKRKTMVFGDRFPFRYFADAYGLSYFAAFPGCSTETECSAATIVFLVNKIRNENIPAVFHIELSNEKIADTICEETGAKKLLLHAVHNITKRDFDRGANYYDLMTQNIGTLRQALY
ncbi:MAG: metal ABC transporter substrate-binding protein [Spirochaetaceae bacterium]|jgi:zinc transport system substrate-binding protein|nr:metal ABC transporter substrate-binding protein [Spirochaetaceae bacterium]